MKYPTNLSVISFQDASLASPKLSVTLFKDHCNILSCFFIYVSVSNLHFPQMNLAAEKPPEAVLEGVIFKFFLREHAPRLPYIMACFAHQPSSLMEIWPDWIFLASYGPGQSRANPATSDIQFPTPQTTDLILISILSFLLDMINNTRGGTATVQPDSLPESGRLL